MALLSAQALVCERALIERDNVSSLVRLVDWFYIPAETPVMPDGNFPSILMTLFVVLKLSAEDGDEHEIRLDLVRPDGKESAGQTVKQTAEPSKIPGYMRAFNISAQVGVNPSQHGPHEFKVIFDGSHVTSAWFFISRFDADGSHATIP